MEPMSVYFPTTNGSLYQVNAYWRERKHSDKQVSAVMTRKVSRLIEPLSAFKAQEEVLSIAAEAAYNGFSQLDKRNGFSGRVDVALSFGVSAPFKTNSTSSGLSYALALFHAWYDKVLSERGIPVPHWPLIVATGQVSMAGDIFPVEGVSDKVQGLVDLLSTLNATPDVLFVCHPENLSDEVRATLDAHNIDYCAQTQLPKVLKHICGDSYHEENVETNPFKGLDSFDEVDALRFFGRDKERDTIIEKLEDTTQPLIVSGSSGSGKSSLLKAGVIPKLRQMYEDIIIDMTTPEKVGADITTWLEKTSLHKPDSQKLLIVDQTEQLFRDDKRTIEKWIDALIQWHNNTPNLLLIISLRSEFKHQLEQHSAFRSTNDYNLLPQLNASQWDDILNKQIKYANLDIKTPLLDRLKQDAKDIDDNLPLISLLLRQIYEKANENRSREITIDDYEAAGQLEGVIDQLADEAISSFSQSTLDTWLPAVFQGLIYIQGDKANSLLARPFTLKDDTPDEIKHIIDALFVKRLLKRLSGTQDIYTVTHERILTSWKRVKNWKDKDSAFVLWSQKVTEQANEWESHNQDKALLSTSVLHIEEIRQWQTENPLGIAQLPPHTQAFIESSIKQADTLARLKAKQARLKAKHAEKKALIKEMRAQHRVKRIRQWSLGAVTSVLVFATAIFFLYKEAVEQEQIAKDELSAKLLRESELAAASARAMIENGQRTKALDLALSVLPHDNDDRPLSQNALNTAIYAANLQDIRGYFQIDDFVNSYYFGPNEQEIIASSKSNSVFVWDIDSGLKRFERKFEDAVVDAFLSTNNDIVVIHKNSIRLIKSTSKVSNIYPIESCDSSIQAMILESSIYILCNDGSLVKWSLDSLDTSFTVPTETTNATMAFSPSGNRILVHYYEGGDVKFYTSEKLEKLAEHALPAARRMGPLFFQTVKLISDDMYLTFGAGEYVTLRDVQSGELVHYFRHQNELVKSADYSIESNLLVTGTFNGNLNFWSTSLGRPVLYIETVTDAAVTSLELINSGQAVVTSSLDKDVNVINPLTGEILQSVQISPSTKNALNFNKDSSMFLFNEIVPPYFFIVLAERKNSEPVTLLKPMKDMGDFLINGKSNTAAIAGNQFVSFYNLQNGSAIEDKIYDSDVVFVEMLTNGHYLVGLEDKVIEYSVATVNYSKTITQEKVFEFSSNVLEITTANNNEVVIALSDNSSEVIVKKEKILKNDVVHIECFGHPFCTAGGLVDIGPYYYRKHSDSKYEAYRKENFKMFFPINLDRLGRIDAVEYVHGHRGIMAAFKGKDGVRIFPGVEETGYETFYERLPKNYDSYIQAYDEYIESHADNAKHILEKNKPINSKEEEN